jgi:hypothetical protein
LKKYESSLNYKESTCPVCKKVCANSYLNNNGAVVVCCTAKCMMIEKNSVNRYAYDDDDIDSYEPSNICNCQCNDCGRIYIDDVEHPVNLCTECCIKKYECMQQC